MVADLEVLAGAPAGMTASGYGDLLGKVTAGADWLVADALGVEPVDPRAWELVQGPLREAVGRPRGWPAATGTPSERLVEGLVMSGLAMQAHASSRPASGAEHQFSHLWEMEGLGHDRRPPLSHGFKVGVGTVAIAALYERLLERDLTALDVEALCRAWPGPEEAEAAVRAAHTTPGLDRGRRRRDHGQARRRRHLGAAAGAARRPLAGPARPPRHPAAPGRAAAGDAGGGRLPDQPVRDRAELAGVPGHLQRARMIRRRYTALDLAAETGTFGELVDELFAPGGFWAEATA